MIPDASATNPSRDVLLSHMSIHSCVSVPQSCSVHIVNDEAVQRTTFSANENERKKVCRVLTQSGAHVMSTISSSLTMYLVACRPLRSQSRQCVMVRSVLIILQRSGSSGVLIPKRVHLRKWLRLVSHFSLICSHVDLGICLPSGSLNHGALNPAPGIARTSFDCVLTCSNGRTSD